MILNDGFTPSDPFLWNDLEDNAKHFRKLKMLSWWRELLWSSSPVNPCKSREHPRNCNDKIRKVKFVH